MPAIENVLRTYLIADAAVASLVSTRVYPDALPLGAVLPAIFYSIVSDVGEDTHEGAAAISFTRIQYTLVAASYSQLQALTLAVKARLRNYVGTLEGVRIKRVKYELAMDLELGIDELTQPQRRRALDFRVAHTAG